MSQWRESRHMDIIQWELENVIFQLGTLLSLINESHLIKENKRLDIKKITVVAIELIILSETLHKNGYNVMEYS